MSGPSDPSYFSVDNGVTNLDSWNNPQIATGDLTDWAPHAGPSGVFKYAGADAFLNNSPPGQINALTGTDLILMAALGYQVAAPVLGHDNPLSVAAGTTATISSNQLSVSSPTNVFTDADLTYTIVTAPSDGALLKNGSATSSFTQADIDNGLIAYHETASNASSDSFTFYVSDPAGGHTANTSFQFQITQPDVTISALPNLSGYSTLGTGDFNDDGFSSIVLQNKSNGQMEIWYMGNGQIVADYHYGNLTGYAMLGSGDFNGDGTSDIVWQNMSTGQAEIWSMKDGALIADTPIGNLAGYSLIGTGDFTGSGTSDMVWQNKSTGQADIWIMSNSHLAADIPLGNLGGYNLIGTADLNGDHQTDLIWQNNATGAVDVWFMGNGHIVADYGYGNLSGYKLLATGDINHDGTTALLWQNEATGEVSDWIISPQTGRPNSFQSFGIQTLNFQETASGHNSDGSPDVLWQDPTTGQTQFWNVSHNNAQGTAANSGAVAAASAAPSAIVSQGSSITAASNDTFVFQPNAGAPLVADGRSTDPVGLDGISSLAKNEQLAALLDEGQISQSQTLFDSGHDTAINLADHDSTTTARGRRPACGRFHHSLAHGWVSTKSIGMEVAPHRISSSFSGQQKRRRRRPSDCCTSERGVSQFKSPDQGID